VCCVCSGFFAMVKMLYLQATLKYDKYGPCRFFTWSHTSFQS